MLDQEHLVKFNLQVQTSLIILPEFGTIARIEIHRVINMPPPGIPKVSKLLTSRIQTIVLRQRLSPFILLLSCGVFVNMHTA